MNHFKAVTLIPIDDRRWIVILSFNVSNAADTSSKVSIVSLGKYSTCYRVERRGQMLLKLVLIR